MSCDCKFLGAHEEWCDDHPENLKDEQIEELKAKLDIAVKTLEAIACLDQPLEELRYLREGRILEIEWARDALIRIRGEK